MCSARSLGSAISSAARRSSSSSVRPRRPRAGQRADRHPVALHPHHDLRRAAHQTKRTRLEVKQERAGVDDAQRPVNVERPGLRLGLQALAEDDLKGVAGLDVLDALGHGRLEGAPARSWSGTAALTSPTGATSVSCRSATPCCSRSTSRSTRSHAVW